MHEFPVPREDSVVWLIPILTSEVWTAIYMHKCGKNVKLTLKPSRKGYFKLHHVVLHFFEKKDFLIWVNIWLFEDFVPYFVNICMYWVFKLKLFFFEIIKLPCNKPLLYFSNDFSHCVWVTKGKNENILYSQNCVVPELPKSFNQRKLNGCVLDLFVSITKCILFLNKTKIRGKLVLGTPISLHLPPLFHGIQPCRV